MTEIVVAIQNIPRGMQIRVEDLAIELQSGPMSICLMSSTLVWRMLTAHLRGWIFRAGCRFYLICWVNPVACFLSPVRQLLYFAPNNLVAYAIPMDTQGAVAWAIQPGDRVDVLAALKMMAMDPGAYTENIRMFTILAEEDIPPQTSPFGQF